MSDGCEQQSVNKTNLCENHAACFRMEYIKNSKAKCEAMQGGETYIPTLIQDLC